MFETGELNTGDYLQTVATLKRRANHRRGPQNQPNRKKVGYALEEDRCSVFPHPTFDSHTHHRKPFQLIIEKRPLEISTELWNNIWLKKIWIHMKTTGSRASGHLRGEGEEKYNRAALIPCRNDIILNKCGDYCCYCGVSMNYGVGMHLPYYHDQGITDRPSIDRIVSSKGYIYDNVVICCDDCNTLKSNGPPWPYLINSYISDPKIKEYLKVILDNFDHTNGYLVPGRLTLEEYF